MTLPEFLHIHSSDLAVRTFEHVTLCTVTLASACLIAVPAGVMLTGAPRFAAALMAFASVVQTVPSLALLGMLMVMTGQIGYVPSLIALFLYSLLPILRNTHVGISQTPPASIYAGTALGMTGWQLLWDVRFPLALPVIIAGVRTSAVLVIGTATLCAFIGAGGLGVFINRGIETVDSRLVMLGVIPVSLMALLSDWAFSRLGRLLSPPGGIENS
jgi:osmoprotectant transport system permease protein